MGMFDFLKSKAKGDNFAAMDIDAPNVYPTPPLNQSPNAFTHAQLSQMSQPSPPMVPPPMGAPSQPMPTTPPMQFSGTDMNQPPMDQPMAPLPPPPAPPSASSPSLDEVPVPDSSNMEMVTEDIEKIAENIIDEKWQKISATINEVEAWKKDVENQINSLKSSIDKMDSKVADTQKAMLSKVNDYNKTLTDVNVELKAMSKVFDKVLPTFTDNVKKLSTITGKISKKK